jgi:hypothetical protein
MNSIATHPDPLITGAAPLPSRRAALGRVAGLAGAALAAGSIAGFAGPVLASVSLPDATANLAGASAAGPLSAPLRRYLERVVELLEWPSVKAGHFVVMAGDDGRLVFINARVPGLVAECEESGAYVLAEDAADQLRTILAAGAEGGLARG